MMILRGALIEYGSDFLGPLPNVVLFQFNPESISRTIEVPPRPTGIQAREVSQAGDTPVERFTIRAEFDAADHLNQPADTFPGACLWCRPAALGAGEDGASRFRRPLRCGHRRPGR